MRRAHKRAGVCANEPIAELRGPYPSSAFLTLGEKQTDTDRYNERKTIIMPKGNTVAANEARDKRRIANSVCLLVNTLLTLPLITKKIYALPDCPIVYF